MHCSCVRQTELPHTTALAADTFYLAFRDAQRVNFTLVADHA